MTTAATHDNDQRTRQYLTDTWAIHDRLQFTETAQRVAARLSHPKQQTPLSVAVQGPDGSGKTTFMRLICQYLPSTHMSLSIWYEPWRFDTARDAWRGLIYELTDGLGRAHAPRRGWLTSARSLIDRRWSYDLLQAVEDDPGGPEVTRQFRYYLERVTERLHRQRQQDSPLVVVFIDDLDRCTRESAAAVLQASTLLLNSRGFVTVFGLTPGAFNSIGRSSLSGNGTGNGMAAERFFQIALQVPTVSRAQFRAYVEACVDESGCALGSRWINLLGKALFPNPRDVKRFLNYFISEWDKAESAQLILPQDETSQDMTSSQGAHPQFLLLALLSWRFPKLAEYLRSPQADPEAFERLVRAALRSDAENTAAPASDGMMADAELAFLADPTLSALLVDAFAAPAKGSQAAPLVPAFGSRGELAGFLFQLGGASAPTIDPSTGTPVATATPEWSTTTSLREARDRSATRGAVAAAKWSEELLERRNSSDPLVRIRAYRDQARNNQQMGLGAASLELAKTAYDIAEKDEGVRQKQSLAFAEAHLALSEHFTAFAAINLDTAIDHADQAHVFALATRDPDIQLQALVARAYARKLAWQTDGAIAHCEEALALDEKTYGLRDVALRLMLAELHHRKARAYKRKCLAAGAAAQPALAAAWCTEITAALSQISRIETAIANGSREQRKRYERLRTRLDPGAPDVPVAFISYAHKNAAAFGRIQDIVQPWTASGHLFVWEDTQIQVGTLWQLEIESALEEATHAIMLWSPEYESSQFINWVEFPRLNAMLERGDIEMLIVPLAGDIAANVRNDIQLLWPQPLDTIDDPEHAWREIGEKLRRELKIPTTPPGPNAGATVIGGASATHGSSLANVTAVPSTAAATGQ